MENMENDYLQGGGTYPKTVAAAFNLLVNWKHDPRNLMHSVDMTNDGVSFAIIKSGQEDKDAEGVTMETSGSSTQQSKKGRKNKHGKERELLKYKCSHCSKYRHYPTHCHGMSLHD